MSKLCHELGAPQPRLALSQALAGDLELCLGLTTLSQHLRDQDGGFAPLFIYSTGDYKSPLFVYLLAGLFRITGPSTPYPWCDSAALTRRSSRFGATVVSLFSSTT